MHSQLRHKALTLRDGKPVSVDVTTLVPGDVVQLSVGDVVPADLRLLRADSLQCDESVLTGESLPVEKQAEPCAAPSLRSLSRRARSWAPSCRRAAARRSWSRRVGHRVRGDRGTVGRSPAPNRPPGGPARLLEDAGHRHGDHGRRNPGGQPAHRPPAGQTSGAVLRDGRRATRP